MLRHGQMKGTNMRAVRLQSCGTLRRAESPPDKYGLTITDEKVEKKRVHCCCTVELCGFAYRVDRSTEQVLRVSQCCSRQDAPLARRTLYKSPASSCTPYFAHFRLLPARPGRDRAHEPDVLQQMDSYAFKHLTVMGELLPLWRHFRG